MSSTATVTGNVTFPVLTGGAPTSHLIGAPVITTTSTTGAQLTYNEGGAKSVKVVQGAPVTLSFDTVSAADMFYVGTDQPITVALNGLASIATLPAGGFILMYKAGVASAILTATTSNAATVSVLILGD